MLKSKFNGYSADGHRTMFKGKGGGKDRSAQIEAQRQARIRAATDAINRTFANANRQALYDEQKQAVYDLNMRDLRQQQAEAERANRFALARTGLLGSSVDVGTHDELQKAWAEGEMQSIAAGDAAAAQLMANDENQKQSLISLASTGIDTGTAAASAANALNANYQAALGARAGSSLGDLFGHIGGAYMTAQVQKALQNGYVPPYALESDPYKQNSTRNTNQGTYS